MAKTKVGDVIIAKYTDLNFGHCKGDSLKVIDTGGNDCVSAKNLTRPELTEGEKNAVLHVSQYKHLRKIGYEKDSEKKAPWKVYFLGIPLFTIKEDN